MYSILVSNSSKYKKAKGVNKIVFAKIGHNEHNNILLNKKCLRHSMNTIQSKNQRIGTYKIKKDSLSCFENKIYILDNRIDVLSLGCFKLMIVI